jgi:hypothetical protein
MKILLTGLWLWIISGGAWAAAPAFAERQTVSAGAYHIEFDPADGEYVRALTRELEAGLPASSDPVVPFGLAELVMQREDILREIAQTLGPANAPAETGKVYDSFVHAMNVLQKTMVSGAPRRFALWRKPDLVARLRAGQQIPGFALEGDEVVIQLNVNFDTDQALPPDVLAARVDKAWGELVWPMKIGELSPEADVSASLETLRNYKRSMMGNEPWLVMGTLHEAIEFSLVNDVIRSADRRWFCEGMANYLAREIIRKRVGPELSRAYYDGDALLAQVPQTAKQGDLEAWPVGEDGASRHVPGEINEVNYLRATRVVEAVVAKHGTDVLAKWFTEIRKTPHGKTDRATVYAAYNKVTGADLRPIVTAH